MKQGSVTCNNLQQVEY